MQKKLTAILLVLSLGLVINMFGQDVLKNSTVSDSLVKKFSIKQVTENWFHDSLLTSPANITIEKFDETGKRTQRIYTNPFYHKFIDHYKYNVKKKTIIKTQYFYDWSHNKEKRKGVTIVKKTVTKYDLYTGRNVKTKPHQLEAFQPRLTFDQQGRVTERTDTIKSGYQITHYSYNKIGRLVERTYYRTRDDEKPVLYAMDSLHYNLNGQLIKETNYYDNRMVDDKWEFDREIITTYQYNLDGLIQEKTNLIIFHTLKDREFKPTVFRYEYQFY